MHCVSCSSQLVQPSASVRYDSCDTITTTRTASAAATTVGTGARAGRHGQRQHRTAVIAVRVPLVPQAREQVRCNCKDSEERSTCIQLYRLHGRGQAAAKTAEKEQGHKTRQTAHKQAANLEAVSGVVNPRALVHVGDLQHIQRTTHSEMNRASASSRMPGTPHGRKRVFSIANFKKINAEHRVVRTHTPPQHAQQHAPGTCHRQRASGSRQRT
jgi:hypothetical protein